MRVKQTPSEFFQVLKEGRKNLLEPEAKSVLADHGIPVTQCALARNEEETVREAEKMGFPVVLKIVSPDIIHKSDVGGVIVNLRTAKEVRDAYRQIMISIKKKAKKAKIVGILIQEMAPPSTEVIIGSVKDPQFGPAIMFGLGGIFIEVLKDVTFRIAPLTKEEALEMVEEVKAYPLLKGYRNLPPADLEAIVDILVKTSMLVMEHPEIKELDLNPVMVYSKGAKTVDARIVLE